MEKLGVEKQQLIEELQAEYNRLTLQEHDLRKEGSEKAPQRAQVSNELEQIKQQLNSLQSNS